MGFPHSKRNTIIDVKRSSDLTNSSKNIHQSRLMLLTDGSTQRLPDLGQFKIKKKILGLSADVSQQDYQTESKTGYSRLILDSKTEAKDR